LEGKDIEGKLSWNWEKSR